LIVTGFRDSIRELIAPPFVLNEVRVKWLAGWSRDSITVDWDRSNSNTTSALWTKQKEFLECRR